MTLATIAGTSPHAIMKIALTDGGTGHYRQTGWPVLRPRSTLPRLLESSTQEAPTGRTTQNGPIVTSSRTDSKTRKMTTTRHWADPMAQTAFVRMATDSDRVRGQIRVAEISRGCRWHRSCRRHRRGWSRTRGRAEKANDQQKHAFLGSRFTDRRPL